jgi:hypothetical protein
MTKLTQTDVMYPDLDALCKQTAPLYHRYHQQTEAQPAYLEIDPEGRSVRVDWDDGIGGAVPMYVYHGLLLRYPLPCAISGRALADWLTDAEVRDLVARIIDAYYVHWDGSDNCGCLREDGGDASERLASLCETLAGDIPDYGRQR